MHRRPFKRGVCIGSCTRTSGCRLPAASFGEIAHESVAFGDLSWSRLNSWRVLTAELFDAPADQELLDSIERVMIEYTKSAAANEIVQALLYGLAQRRLWRERQWYFLAGSVILGYACG